MASVVAVVFDVGETLIDETEAWGGWADWLGVPRLTLFATLGGVIARGGHHSDALRMVRPGIDVDAETQARDAAGHGFRMTADDLYPDAMPCLQALAADGIVIGIAGNQPASTETVLRGMDVPLALVASSQRWGVEKPDPAFFARVCAELRLSAEEIVYVGDRLDNDVGRRCCRGHESGVPASRPVGDHPVGVAGPGDRGRRGHHRLPRGVARSPRGDRRRCSLIGRALRARPRPGTTRNGCNGAVATSRRLTVSACVQGDDVLVLGRQCRDRAVGVTWSGKARPRDAGTDNRQPRIEGGRVSRRARFVDGQTTSCGCEAYGVRTRIVVVDHQSRATSRGRRRARSCLS